MRTAEVGRHYGVTDRRFVSSIKMKTILAEALTPVHAVNAKIHRVESLLLFPRTDGNCALLAP